MSEREFIHPSRVRDALSQFLPERLGLRKGCRIENLKWLGDGLYSIVFGFWLSDAGPLDGPCVVRILNPLTDDPDGVERLVRSARLLDLLSEHKGLAPRTLAFDVTGEWLGRPFTVETWASGLPLGVAPKDPERDSPIAAEQLARVHSVPLTEAIRALLKRHEPEAQVRAGSVPRTGEVAHALEVATGLRPTPSGEVLLHGDPLLQNLVFLMDESGPGERYTWIDWEFARIGHRAYDLSIFTRGKLDGRRTLYFEAYRRASGIDLPEKDLLYYEILLVVRMVDELLAEKREHEAQDHRNRLAKLVRRAAAP